MNIKEFDKRVEYGILRKTETEHLVLYTYTDQCTYENNWDEYTKVARGIILEKSTGNIIAKPFPKFFNLGEKEDTFLLNLPKLAYIVTEKLDGSLGIVYYYNNKWNIATKGSFDSDQAVEATKMLENYDLSDINTDITLLTEIIYPENKIVIDYKDERKLVLLGAYNRVTEEEIDRLHVKGISNRSGMSLVHEYYYNIEEMIELQKTLPKDKEGFVIRFDNGLRVKIKGDEYCKIHKILSQCTPLAFFETMKNGKVPIEFLQQIPEELRELSERITKGLEINYNKILVEVHEDFNKLPKTDDRKTIGLFIKDNNLKHSNAMFPIYLGRQENLDKYIMKYIRPDGNVL